MNPFQPSQTSGHPARDFDSSVRNIEFSVVDVETTGLFPDHHDRIIEIAVVRVNVAGNVLDEYSTLVNPNRDLGPTHIHGICAGDVANAPCFGDIAGDVIERLGGAIFTGFYPDFDFRFMRSEMRRIGYEIPSTQVLGVNHLARSVDPSTPGRKLEVCCKHFGIPLEDAHSAYCDACATAKLLCACIGKAKQQGNVLLEQLGIKPFPRKDQFCPALRVSGKCLTRSETAKSARSQSAYIDRLVSSLPAANIIDPKLDQYFALLDRILEDRLVTPHEGDALLKLALDLGISREQARKAHLAYMRDLFAVALADGVISPSEEQDLRNVRGLLSIPSAAYAEMLCEALEGTRRARNANPRNPGGAGDLANKTVCFTGEFTSRISGHIVSRDFAERLAQQKGMIVRNGVTKDLDILVAADPNSMSGKAKKAKKYGIRIVAEPVFWQWMGINLS